MTTPITLCADAHYGGREYPALCNCACHDTPPEWPSMRARARQLWNRWTR